MKPVIEVFIEVQRGIFEQTGQRTDVHYEKGKGALIVPEGYALHPQNVMLAISEMQIRMMRY